MSNFSNTGKRRLPLPVMIAFTAPNFAGMIILTPLAAVIPGFYASSTAVTVGHIGVLIMVARIFDAVTDPLIGYLSDRTKSGYGRRKPWILGGVALAIPSLFFVFTPDADTGPAYFISWSLLAYLGLTMVGIPYNAWAAEITGHYRERARIATFRSVFGSLGGVVFYAIPFLPIFATTEVNGDVLRFTALVGPALMIAMVLAAVIFVPEGPEITTQDATAWDDIAAVLCNKPFRTYLAAMMLMGLGAGVFATSSFLYINDYLGLGEQYSSVSIILLITGILALPIWLRVLYRIGKHRAWAVGALAPALVLPLAFFIEPGPQSLLPLLAVLIIFPLGYSVGSVAEPALLADVVDYDTLKTGQSRAGNYFAVYSIMQKLNIAIGGGLGFLILAFFGYTPNAENTAMAKVGMISTIAFIPSIFFVAAFFFQWAFPIDERRQKIIRKRIEQREHRVLQGRVPISNLDEAGKILTVPARPAFGAGEVE